MSASKQLAWRKRSYVLICFTPYSVKHIITDLPGTVLANKRQRKKSGSDGAQLSSIGLVVR